MLSSENFAFLPIFAVLPCFPHLLVTKGVDLRASRVRGNVAFLGNVKQTFADSLDTQTAP
jgi:hypothetical protein